MKENFISSVISKSSYDDKLMGTLEKNTDFQEELLMASKNEKYDAFMTIPQNQAKMQELATDATLEAFSDSVTIILSDSFNKQLNEDPLRVYIYSSAVSAYRSKHKMQDEPASFPDLTAFYEESSSRSFTFHLAVNMAKEELLSNYDKNLNNQTPVAEELDETKKTDLKFQRLHQNINLSYKKKIEENKGEKEIGAIASFGIIWHKEEEKSFEQRNEEELKKAAQLNQQFSQLSTMAAENYGEFLADNYMFFEDLMQKPALTIAMAEYMQIFKHQNPKKTPPSLEDMLDNPEIKNLAEAIKNPQIMVDKIPELAKDMDPYDALVPLLNEVKENPQNFFTKEGFTNTTQFDNIRLNLAQQAKSGVNMHV